MNSSLTRPLAVVTGASNGIGYELAKQFTQNNFALIVTATGPSSNEADRAFETLGAQVETVQADIATYQGVDTLYENIKATGRSVDAIAINAGVGVGGDFARETDLKDELNPIELNVVSSVHLAQRVVKDMVDRGQGRILFTSSFEALMAGKDQIIAGSLKTRIMGAGSQILPDTLKAEFHHQLTEPGSAKK